MSNKKIKASNNSIDISIAPYVTYQDDEPILPYGIQMTQIEYDSKTIHVLDFIIINDPVTNLGYVAQVVAIISGQLFIRVHHTMGNTPPGIDMRAFDIIIGEDRVRALESKLHVVKVILVQVIGKGATLIESHIGLPDRPYRITGVYDGGKLRQEVDVIKYSSQYQLISYRDYIIRFGSVFRYFVGSLDDMDDVDVHESVIEVTN
jgi:hypothetical protein